MSDLSTCSLEESAFVSLLKSTTYIQLRWDSKLLSQILLVYYKLSCFCFQHVDSPAHVMPPVENLCHEFLHTLKLKPRPKGKLCNLDLRLQF